MSLVTNDSGTRAKLTDDTTRRRHQRREAPRLARLLPLEDADDTFDPRVTPSRVHHLHYENKRATGRNN